MYQQLQAQAQAQAHSSPRPAVPYVQPSQSPTIQNTIVVPQAGASPATSVRSTASINLGQLQTDPNGNQGMNI
jgi:hypothetical protein